MHDACQVDNRDIFAEWKQWLHLLEKISPFNRVIDEFIRISTTNTYICINICANDSNRDVPPKFHTYIYYQRYFIIYMHENLLLFVTVNILIKTLVQN